MTKSESSYLGARLRRRFDELFERRFSERPDAVSSWRSPQQIVQLFGDNGTRGVLLSRYGNGTRSAISTISTTLRADQAAHAELTMEPDGKTLVAEGAHPGRWLRLLDDMENMFLTLPSYVPFGHVVDGEVHDIIYTGFGGPDFGGGADYYYGSTDRYVLEGSRLQHPSSLDMPSRELSDLLWSQVDSGQLVRLGRRFRAQPGEITARWDGTLERISFGETDNLRPTLAPGGRSYLSWNYVEDRPSGSGRPYKPYTSPLRKWFAV